MTRATSDHAPAPDIPVEAGAAAAQAPVQWGVARTKTVSWWWPEGLHAEIAGLSGLEYLQGIVDGRFPPPPIASVFATRLVRVAPGEAAFRCVPDESLLNPSGLVHGGVLSMLLDSAMGVAVQTEVDATVGYATIELKVSFLRPLPSHGEEIEVRGRTLKVGRKVAFAEGHAYDSRGRLLGHGTTSLARID
jgi:uncharacterized protein (TIGR00369 family)